MTTMLERAAGAAMTVCVGFNEEGDDVYVGSNTAEELARAVLMAVRQPNDALSAAVRTTDGWEDMIDAILEGK